MRVAAAYIRVLVMRELQGDIREKNVVKLLQIKHAPHDAGQRLISCLFYAYGEYLSKFTLLLLQIYF